MHSTPPNHPESDASPAKFPFRKERNPNYPKARPGRGIPDEIVTADDRYDFLVAAYNLMISKKNASGENAFDRLSRLSHYTSRFELIQTIAGTKGQSRLAGIFKKLLGGPIDESGLNAIMREIQETFRRDTIKPERVFDFAKDPGGESVKIAEVREVVREEAAGVLSHPVHRKGKVLQALPKRKPTLPTPLSSPVARIHSTTHEGVNQFLEDRTTPPPRAEYRGTSRTPRVPDCSRENGSPEISIPAPQPTPAKIPEKSVELPEFNTIQEAIKWLFAQKKWEEVLGRIFSLTETMLYFDELKLVTILREHTDLEQVIKKIRTQFHYPDNISFFKICFGLDK